jgi:hypothetical protein
MSGKAVRETLAALGVIASLVFVGMEIRQNTTVARAATRQAMAETAITLFDGPYSDAELNRQLFDWIEAEDADPNCRETRFCMWIRGLLRAHENVFLQVQLGVLDESAFDSYACRGVRVYQSPRFRAWWPAIRGLHDPNFVSAFEAEYDLAR